MNVSPINYQVNNKNNYVNFQSGYNQRSDEIGNLVWYECWDIPWEQLSDRQKFEFAKYALSNNRIKTSQHSYNSSEKSWYELDCGKHTAFSDTYKEGYDYVSYTKTNHTYQLEGYGTLKYTSHSDSDKNYNCSYDGKDPRPVCRDLWDKQLANKEGLAYRAYIQSLLKKQNH